MSAEGTGVPAAGSEIFNDLYRQMVETVPAVTYVLPFGHTDERYLYVSPQSEAVLGLTHDEMMVGVSERFRRIHPDDRGRIVRNAAEETGPWDEEYRLLLPDGTTRWVHDQTHLVPASGDRPAMWFGVITPLDRREHADTSDDVAEARYQALVEQLPAVVYIDTYEERPVTLFVSRQVEKVTGYPPEAWITDPDLWIKVIHPDDPRSTCAATGRSSSTVPRSGRTSTRSCTETVASCGSGTWRGWCIPPTARRCSGKA